MARPYQKANIPGPEMGTSVTDPQVMANILKDPKKKVFVIGPEALTWEVGEKKIVDLYVEIANKIDCDVVSTGHAYGYLKDKIDAKKLRDMSLINIITRLGDENWNGFDGQGQYNMAIFGGHLVFYISQGLSKLKNFTNWLKTVDLDKYSHPNARFSLPNLSNDDWKEFLEALIAKL